MATEATPQIRVLVEEYPRVVVEDAAIRRLLSAFLTRPLPAPEKKVRFPWWILGVVGLLWESK